MAELVAQIGSPEGLNIESVQESESVPESETAHRADVGEERPAARAQLEADRAFLDKRAAQEPSGVEQRTGVQ